MATMDTANTTEQIVKKIKPTKLVLLQYVVWYIVLIAVPILWFNGFNNNLFLYYLIYLAFITSYLVYNAYLWFTTTAYLTNQRLIVASPGQSQKNWFGIRLNDIEQAVVTYPNRIMRALSLGSIAFKKGAEGINLHAIAKPQQLVNEVMGTQPVVAPAPAIVEAPIAAPIQVLVPETAAVVTEPVVEEPTWFSEPMTQVAAPSVITASAYPDNELIELIEGQPAYF